MQKTFMQPLIFSNTVLCITSAQHPTVSYGLFFFWLFDKKAWGNTQNEATVYSTLFMDHRREAIFKQRTVWME